MYTVWHVDKYKITFKLVINWTNYILQHIAVSSGLSRSGIIDARARYRAAARRLRNTSVESLTVRRLFLCLYSFQANNQECLEKGHEHCLPNTSI